MFILRNSWMYTVSLNSVSSFELLSGVLQVAVYEPVINVALFFLFFSPQGVAVGTFQSLEYHHKYVLCCTDNAA